MNKKSFSLDVGGKTMTAEFTDLAEQASGSVILRYGNTAVLATAVLGSKTRDDIDYFPLSVEYEERFYAAGAILGSRFQRREGRPTDEAILSGRVVDRTIRPLFDSRIRNEVQVIITVLSIDEDDPDQMAVNAASLALATSNIPWGGPVSAVRIGLKRGDSAFHINPTYVDRQSGDMTLDVLACGKDGTINMIEVGAKEASEDEIASAFARASEEHAKIQGWQESIVKEIGKEKRVMQLPEMPQELITLYENEFKGRMTDAVISGEAGKHHIHELKDAWMKRAVEVLPDAHKGLAGRFFEDHVDECIHTEAIKNNRRADGRSFDEIRPLFAQAGGVSPILHGSGIFYRGGTHVFTALTLGGPGDSQILDNMEERSQKKRFMHHYNFPPYSAGETGRVGGLNRRMVGHGALAEKALVAVLPDMDAFPYTIRLVSECFASNGSTSMGSVCASTLALMDGGVPITSPVAGIAMGLMMHDGAYKVLTDIQGPEDEHGDMDFKVAGTKNGVTAIQMDIKVDGVPVPVLAEALAGARAARLRILEVIQSELAAPRSAISPRAPEILTLTVKPDQIGMVIGGGGKTINGIKEMAGVSDITIEDDGSIFITGTNGSAGKAKAMIEDIVREYHAGEMYDGEVTRMMDFGAFVRIGNGKNAEGLVHVSEIAPFRIEKVGEALSVGERVRVIIKEIDEKGRINLSIKAADPDFASRKGLGPKTSTTPNRERPTTN